MVLHSSPGVLDLFRSSKRAAIYTLCMWYQAVILGLIYYTSSLTGTLLGGKPHLDFICLFAVEFSCNMLCCILGKRVPRKRFMCGMCVVLAAALVVLAAFQYRVYAVNIVASLIVKGSVSSLILICFLFIHETYPTRFRGVGYGTFQLVYWTSASVEPFLRSAVRSVGILLLPALYACGILVSAVPTVCVLRETVMKPLSDDVDDEKAGGEAGGGVADDDGCTGGEAGKVRRY